MKKILAFALGALIAFGASAADIRAKAPFTLKKAASWPVHNVLAPVAQ